MKRTCVWVCVVAAVCGCARSPEDKIADLLDRLQPKLPKARMLPGPKRWAELHDGEQRSLQPKRAAELDELVALGPKAVPALIALLDDDRRQETAAFVLGEIGGEAAARALLHAFEELLPDVETDHVYHVQDGGKTVLKGGSRTHVVGGSSGFFGELTHALSIAGVPVMQQLMDRTAQTLASAAKLPPTEHEAEVVQDDDGLVAYRYDKFVQDARVLIPMLGMLGDERAVPVFVEALRSPVETIRGEAIRSSTWLASKKLLPHLAPFLEDESPWGDRRVKDEALDAVAYIMHRRSFSSRQHRDLKERDRIAAVYVRRIAEMKAGD